MSGRRLKFGLFKISLLLALIWIPANPDDAKHSSAWFSYTQKSRFLIFYILKKWFKRILNWLWTHLCAISLFRSRLVIGLFQNLSGWPWFVWSQHKQFSCTFCTSWPRKLRFWKEICVLFWNLCITRACNNNLYLYSLLLKNKLRKWIY